MIIMKKLGGIYQVSEINNLYIGYKHCAYIIPLEQIGTIMYVYVCIIKDTINTNYEINKYIEKTIDLGFFYSYIINPSFLKNGGYVGNLKEENLKELIDRLHKTTLYKTDGFTKLQ